MNEITKVGIIICNRYKSCAGGKCFRSLKNREGAFSIYKDKEVELVGYTSCGGCPGGNIEYTPDEMIKNGANVIHLATGMVVGDPPCQHVHFFKKFIEEKYKIPVVIGTHPIPEKYLKVHKELESWNAPKWAEALKNLLTDETTRLLYD